MASTISAVTGEFRKHASFASTHLKAHHDIIIHLPPGYGECGCQYPVLYLQDGQNLFDPGTAFGGHDWGLDHTVNVMVRDAKIEPLIVVGIYNAGKARVSEYTPSRDRYSGKGGKALDYGKMLVDELKPMIDAEYHTKAGPEDTGIGGSSLGGLVSLAVGLEFPFVFGKIALLSPSVWWDHRSIIGKVHSYRQSPRPKIWLDMGTEEGSHPEMMLRDARWLRDALILRGWKAGDTLAYYEDVGAGHNEGAWGYRAGAALQFLFPR